MPLHKKGSIFISWCRLRARPQQRSDSAIYDSYVNPSQTSHIDPYCGCFFPIYSRRHPNTIWWRTVVSSLIWGEVTDFTIASWKSIPRCFFLPSVTFTWFIESIIRGLVAVPSNARTTGSGSVPASEIHEVKDRSGGFGRPKDSVDPFVPFRVTRGWDLWMMILLLFQNWSCFWGKGPSCFFWGGKGGIEKQIPRRLEMDSDSGVVKSESLKKRAFFRGWSENWHDYYMQGKHSFQLCGSVGIGKIHDIALFWIGEGTWTWYEW